MNIDRVLTVASVLISAIISYYFYSVSILKREPTAIISSERTSIVNSSLPELSYLTVLFKGNRIEQNNVTAIRIYFWNACMLAIHKADILENDRTIHIVFPENIQILKPLILKVSRDIINMKSLLCEGSQHDICVTFDILEHNDGAAIQVIYGGPSNADPKISGTIGGAGMVKIQKSYSKMEDISLFDSITYFFIFIT